MIKKLLSFLITKYIYFFCQKQFAFIKIPGTLYSNF